MFVTLLQESRREDPFSNLEDHPQLEERPSSRGSSASSIFAASSVMTVYRAPHRNGTNYGNRVLSPRDRKLSVIIDEDGNPRTVVVLPERSERPPSYEYDFDEKPQLEYDDGEIGI